MRAQAMSYGQSELLLMRSLLCSSEVNSRALNSRNRFTRVLAKSRRIQSLISCSCALHASESQEDLPLHNARVLLPPSRLFVLSNVDKKE